MDTPSSNDPPADLSRPFTSILPSSKKTPSFLITAANRSYNHQYANIYFVRLALLRKVVEKRAALRWGDINGDPVYVKDVLGITKQKLCYVVGTIYMEMHLKPNVLDDIARDRSIPAPPAPTKFNSPEDDILLEDTSGRIRLVGDRVKAAQLVTGVTVAVLGFEGPTGDFEVVDVCFAEMAGHFGGDDDDEDEDEEGMKVDSEPNSNSKDTDEWIACISGLNIGALSPSDAQIQLLVEYLTGEEGGLDDQVSASQISRLVIAGNSLAPISIVGVGEVGRKGDEKKARRYGYDSTSFSPHPILNLSAHLLDIGRVMPIHILPGENDPSGTILPQQPFPTAMFGLVSSLSTFKCETNPTYIRLSTDPTPNSPSRKRTQKRTLLVNSGQPVNDMFKYLPSPTTRLGLVESTLRWRHMAPTAPDTLWCHPYFESDPFLMMETPDIYVVGGQKRFGTRLVVDEEKMLEEDDDDDDDEEEEKDRKSTRKRKCRIVLVPEFAETGVLVLVNLRTLDVKTVSFSAHGMTGVSR